MTHVKRVPLSARVPAPMTNAGGPSLTSTATFSAHAINTTGVFRVTEENTIVHSATMDAIKPESSWMRSQGPLPLHTLRENAVLCISAEVVPEQVEALLLSLFTDTAWMSPGVLRVHANAVLNGPYDVDETAARSMGTRRGLAKAFILKCPIERGEGMPEGVAIHDPYIEIFKDGLPVGLENHVFYALMALSARLAGQVCFFRDGTPHVLTRDPDIHTNLTVFAPNAVSVDTAYKLLADILPGLDDASVIQQTDARLARRAARQGNAVVPHPGARAHQPRSPYQFALCAPADKFAMIFVEAGITPVLPPALRWEPWAGKDAAVYVLRWQPWEPEVYYSGRPTRQMRISRAKATRMIEQAAVALAVLTGGAIVDEHGFLVGYRD